MNEDTYRSGGYPHGHRWGIWELDAQRLCLVATNAEGVGIYEIDLETVTSPFWLVDWLEQVAPKKWVGPETLGHLAAALIDLFGPRANMRPDTGKVTFDALPILQRSVNMDLSRR